MERLKILKKLEKKIGVRFNEIRVLDAALTHPTYVFENREAEEHNQRLEFLGDAVLGMVVAEYLYKRYPQKSEGDLTKLRAALVCESSLAENATRIDLGEYMLLGRGEELSGGKERPSILADAYEAVLGAIYLDNGLESVRTFVIKDIEEFMKRSEGWKPKDYKTSLQELVQKHHEENVVYVILEETGPDHDKRFLAGVSFKGKMLAKGKGKSKKEAEQEAAKAAYRKIHSNVKNL